MSCRVLVLDGHWNKSVAAIRSLARAGYEVTVGESSRLAAGMLSRYARRRLRYPSPGKYPQAFLAAVEQEVIRGDYDVLLAMELGTLLLISEERQRFTPHVRLPIASHEVLTRAAAKITTQQAAEKAGLLVPKSKVLTPESDAEQLAETLGLPLVLKPDMGEGGRGLLYCHTLTELRQALEQIGKHGCTYLAQEMVAEGGYGLGVSVLMDDRQQVLASFTHKRLREYPLKGGPSSLRQAVEHEQAERDAITILKELKFSGVAMVEFKVDKPSGQAYFLEINPRFWGSLPLAIAAGVDFPVLLCKWAMAEQFPSPVPKLGTQMRNLLPGDLLHLLGKRGRVGSDFWDLSVRDELLSGHDPGPALGRLLSPLVALWDPQLRAVLKKRQ